MKIRELFPLYGIPQIVAFSSCEERIGEHDAISVAAAVGENTRTKQRWLVKKSSQILSSLILG